MSLFSRVLFVTVLACAAVLPFIMGLHAAKAYPTAVPLDSEENPFLRSHKRLGPLWPGSGRLTGTETAQSWRNPDRDAPLVPYLQSKLLRKGHLGYGPNTQNNGNNPSYLEPMSQVHKGQHLGRVKQASGTSSLSAPQLSRLNHNPFLHTQSQHSGLTGFVAPHNVNSQHWHLPIIRKASQKEMDFPQRSTSPIQKAYENVQFPRSGSSTQPESRSEDKIDWKSPDNPTSFRKSGYWSSKGHTSDNKETNAGARAVYASKYTSFLNQKSLIAPPVSSSKNSSVTKPEKLTSPIVKSSRGELQNSNEKTSYKRVQSSLLRHSHPPDAPEGMHGPNYQHKAFRPNLKSASKGDNPASVIFRLPTKNRLSSYEDTDVAKDAKSGQAVQPNENGQLKESFNLNKGFASWSAFKKNSHLSNTKEIHFESSNYRLVRPSSLQKYSFEQRIASTPSSREDIFRYSTSELTQKLSSVQESVNADNIKVEKSVSGAGQTDEKVQDKPLAKSANISDQVKLTGKPQWNTQGKYKAVTYDDVIGSASFSSVTPAKTGQDEGHFQKSGATAVETEDRTVHSSPTNNTEDDSAGGKTLDFRNGEAEIQLGISDRSVSEEESEAKSVPRVLLTDPEEIIESDSLLELDYLRTSTGNVSFQSLNLNL